ncbi:unnamed protein product [Schistosoma mattheei]|uniref:Uncharacterized protein n=1 Tax=Schistosoma mattheei TaxID=31246 RepID=A0A183PG03_9TREM|nr:unnamed protein product [Schistosoma mattheei]
MKIKESSPWLVKIVLSSSNTAAANLKAFRSTRRKVLAQLRIETNDLTCGLPRKRKERRTDRDYELGKP